MTSGYSDYDLIVIGKDVEAVMNLFLLSLDKYFSNNLKGHFDEVVLEEYSNCLTNKIHLALVIEDCINSEIEIIDQLRDGYANKDEWPKDNKSLYEYKQSSEKLNSRLRLRVLSRLTRLKQ